MPSSAALRFLHSFPTRRSSDLFLSLHQRHAEIGAGIHALAPARGHGLDARVEAHAFRPVLVHVAEDRVLPSAEAVERERHRDRHRSEVHTSELQSHVNLVCRLLLPYVFFTLSLHDALPIYFCHFISGMPKLAPGFTPSRQREVTVLMRV